MAIVIQCLVRCRCARKVLRLYRAAAKDLGKLQLSNDVLKLEIEQLRAKARNETRRVLAEAEERSVRLICSFSICKTCPMEIIVCTCFPVTKGPLRRQSRSFYIYGRSSKQLMQSWKTNDICPDLWRANSLFQN